MSPKTESGLVVTTETTGCPVSGMLAPTDCSLDNGSLGSLSLLAVDIIYAPIILESQVNY